MVQFWEDVFHDAKEWYKTADSKASGIIAINAIMLSITTFGLNLFHNEAVKYQLLDITSLLFYGFLITVLLSVILSVDALWARINLNIIKQSHSSKPKVTSPDLPEIFFSDIAEKYPTTEKTVPSRVINSSS